MSSLIKSQSQFQLTKERFETVISEIKEKLQGRVTTAYIFGSAALGTYTLDSDIDLILVVDQVDKPFVQRGFDYLDLFSIYPCLDILVYTQNELDKQLADSAIGFWKSVRESMRKL
jgi:predicted nucleotidyltransferase